MRLLVTLALLAFAPVVSAGDIHFEVGAANASYQWTDAHYARISARFGDDKWALGMAHVGEQDFSTCPEWGPGACRVYAYRQLFIDVTRYVRWRAIEIGVGPAIGQHMTRITPAHLNFHVSLGLRYKRATLTIHHYSNAGTSPTGCCDDRMGVLTDWKLKYRYCWARHKWVFLDGPASRLMRGRQA